MLALTVDGLPAHLRVGALTTGDCFIEETIEPVVYMVSDEPCKPGHCKAMMLTGTRSGGMIELPTTYHVFPVQDATGSLTCLPIRNRSTN